MSTKTQIRDISRTKTDLDGSEFIVGQDATGPLIGSSFKTTIADVLDMAGELSFENAKNQWIQPGDRLLVERDGDPFLMSAADFNRFPFINVSAWPAGYKDLILLIRWDGVDSDTTLVVNNPPDGTNGVSVNYTYSFDGLLVASIDIAANATTSWAREMVLTNDDSDEFRFSFEILPAVDGLVSLADRERVDGAVGVIVNVHSFYPPVSAFDPHLIMFRNSGTQNTYGTAFARGLLFRRATRVNTNASFRFQSFTEFSRQAFEGALSESDFIKLFWGEGNNYLDIPGFDFPGWKWLVETKSYMTVCSYVIGDDFLGGPNVLMDVFATEPLNVWQLQSIAFTGIQAVVGRGGLQSGTIDQTNLDYPVAIKPKDQVTAAMYWDHDEQTLTLWLRVNDGNAVTTSKVFASPANATWVGYGIGAVNNAFTGTLEFASGIPADIDDALVWMSEHNFGGNRGWYPAWRPAP